MDAKARDHSARAAETAAPPQNPIVGSRFVVAVDGGADDRGLAGGRAGAVVDWGGDAVVAGGLVPRQGSGAVLPADGKLRGAASIGAAAPGLRDAAAEAEVAAGPGGNSGRCPSCIDA